MPLQRPRATAALLLTAFFAVAGSFHHHQLPKTAHDHAGFCSASPVGISLESCALCKLAYNAIQFPERSNAAAALGSASRSIEFPTCSPGAGILLLPDPRAPPAV